MDSTRSLHGRVALVTGANTGIGRAIAERLGAAGAAVMVNYYDEPGLAEDVVGRIRSSGSDAECVHADVSRETEVAAMFAAVDRRWGHLDLLVNNAGIDGGRVLGWEAEPASWQQVIETNLLGSFLCSREALARMVPAKDGAIISITSVHEKIPWAGYSAYTASKAGLAMLMRTLALEAAPHGVRVLSVAPGAIRTPINRDVWLNPETRADLLEKIPTGHLGTADDIAEVVVFLAGHGARYMTGSTVYVDGGMTLYPSFAHGG